MGIALDQEAAGAAGGVEHGFAQARVEQLHHQPHQGARGVELAGVAGRVAHLAQQVFVQRTQRVQFVAGGEVDGVHLVDHVAQQVAALHAVVHAAEDGGDDVAALVAVARGELAQVGEESRPMRTVAAQRDFVVDEVQQVVAGEAVLHRRPVAPAVGRLDGGAEAGAGEHGFVFALAFQVVQEFQEHHPGQQRQAVEVAVQSLVLAHDDGLA